MGTPGFAVPSLEALVTQGHRVLAVVTQPDRPKGRGRKQVPPPLKEAAVRLGLEVFQPEDASSEAFCDIVRARAPDLIIVVAFGQILRRRFLEIPSWGVINIHASLLPAYRGAAPISWAILNGDARTGLTAMRMEEKLDSGPILLQEEVEILPEETAGQLHDRLARLAGPFLIKTLNGLAKGCVREVAQDHAKATYAPKIERGMAEVRWDDSCERICALIRAMDPWPGAHTMFEGREIKCFSPRCMGRGKAIGSPGGVIGYGGGVLQIEAGEGVVGVGELQLAGKRRLPAGAFLRGFPLGVGVILGRQGERAKTQDA